MGEVYRGEKIAAETEKNALRQLPVSYIVVNIKFTFALEKTYVEFNRFSLIARPSVQPKGNARLTFCSLLHFLLAQSKISNSAFSTLEKEKHLIIDL